MVAKIRPLGGGAAHLRIDDSDSTLLKTVTNFVLPVAWGPRIPWKNVVDLTATLSACVPYQEGQHNGS